MKYRLIYYQQDILPQGKQDVIHMTVLEAIYLQYTIEQLSDALQSIRFIKNDFIVNIKTTFGAKSEYLVLIPNFTEKKEVALIILSY
jgi:hypothetical protein